MLMNFNKKKSLKADVFLITFIGIFLLTAFNSIFNSLSVALGSSIDYTTFLMPPSDLFGDYFKAIFSFDINSSLRFSLKGLDKLDIILNEYLQNNNYKTLNPVTGNPSNLNGMPLSTAYYVMNLRLMALINPLVLYIANLFFLLTLLYLVINWLLVSARDKSLFFLAVIFSYPFLFFLVRGHLFSWLTTLSLFAFLVSLEKKRLNLALLFLAIACNFRPNAIIFLPLFLLVIQNRFISNGVKIIFKLMLFFLAIFIPCLLIANYYYAPYTLLNFVEAVANYHSIYVLGKAGLAYGSSLYGLIMSFDPSSKRVEKLILIASFILICITMQLFIKKYINRLSFVFIITSFCCLATSVFADYYLGIFFLPLIFLGMNSSQEKSIPPVNIVQVFSCILLLGPKNYFYFDSGLSYQVLLNPLILCCAVTYTYIDALKHFKNFRSFSQ